MITYSFKYILFQINLGGIQVKFALNLYHIIRLIEKDQIMVLNAFIDHEWTDKRLAWSNFLFIY